LLLLGVGLLFLQEQGRTDTTLDFARTVAVNALIMGEIFYLLSARFFYAPSFTLDGLLGDRMALLLIGVAVALQLLFTYAPFMNVLFDTEPLDLEAWSRCLAVGLALFAVVETEKLVMRRRLSGRAARERGETDGTKGEISRTDSGKGRKRQSPDVSRKEGGDMNSRDKGTRDKDEETGPKEKPAESERAHHREDRKIAEADRKIAETEKRIAEAEKRIVEADLRISDAKEDSGDVEDDDGGNEGERVGEKEKDDEEPKRRDEK
jgi:hypothetical protein